MGDSAAFLKLVAGEVESFGGSLVGRFGALNVWTAALLGGALALDRALSHRARASWRIALYAPIGLRIVLPLDWTIPLPSAPRVASYLTPPLQMFGVRSSLEAAASSGGTWHALVAVIYVAGAVLLAARAVSARVKLGRALATGKPARSVHPDVPCPIVEHDDLGPMAVGLLSPRIVLPRRLLVPGEDHALQCVLRHEAAHLRRGDAWLSAAMQVLAVTAWPVVPLWIAVARVRQLVELACDEAALAGADATERRRYGHALLDMAESKMLPVGAGELHFGSTLRARIEALASQRHWPIALQAVALSLASLGLIGAGGASAPLPVSATSAAEAPAPGDDDTSYGYQFEVDSAKNITMDPSALALPHAGGDRIPHETVQAIVRARYGAFSSCYAAGLSRDPGLTGTVTIKLVAGKDGVTKQALDEGSTLRDEGVVACIVGEFRKIRYPRGGGDLTVLYPVQFAP